MNVTSDDDEMIVVSVDGDRWMMEIGADDEFVFMHESEVIRFPFEESA